MTNCLCPHSRVILVFISLVASQREYVNIKISHSWVHKQFATPTHTLPSIYFIRDFLCTRSHDFQLRFFVQLGIRIYPLGAPRQITEKKTGSLHLIVLHRQIYYKIHVDLKGCINMPSGRLPAKQKSCLNDSRAIISDFATRYRKSTCLRVWCLHLMYARQSEKNLIDWIDNHIEQMLHVHPRRGLLFLYRNSSMQMRNIAC